MKILLLPDSFKGSLSAQRAADILCAAANEVLSSSFLRQTAAKARSRRSRRLWAALIFRFR